MASTAALFGAELGRVASVAELASALAARRWDVIVVDASSPSFSEVLAGVQSRSGQGVAVVVRGPTDPSGASLRRVRAALEAALVPVEPSDWVALLASLSASIGHHVNNALAAVVANLDVALEAIVPMSRGGPCAPLTRQIRGPLEDAREAALKLGMLGRDFAANDPTRQSAPRCLDVRSVIDAAAATAASTSGGAVRLAVRHEGEVPNVIAVERLLVQVLANLFVCARQGFDGRESAGAVRVVVSRLDESATVSIVLGAPEDRRGEPWVFSRSKSRALSAGLSLVVCYRMLAAFGGDLEVDHRGDSVRVLLPAAAEEPGRLPEPAREGSHGSEAPGRGDRPRSHPRRRVLVVDDEEAAGRAMARILGAHDVVVRTDAVEALAEIERGARYDAIVCDLAMDEMDGVELEAAIRQRVPELAERMLFVTGGAITPAASAFVRSSQRPILMKPFSADELRAAVAALLR